MIELTGQDGLKLAINASAIWHIRKGTGEQTAIYAVSGAAIFVLEAYDEVLALCRAQLARPVAASDAV